MGRPSAGDQREDDKRQLQVVKDRTSSVNRQEAPVRPAARRSAPGSGRTSPRLAFTPFGSWFWEDFTAPGLHAVIIIAASWKTCLFKRKRPAWH